MNTARLNKQGHILIEQTYLANTPWLRLRGLLGRPPLADNQGMLILPCNSVHTIGMTYPLDIVYLDEKNRVLKITENLSPWRGSGCKGATKVLELVAGNASKKNIKQGDILSW
ncbi:DUF192 domain-containing protein [Shewanella halifaxensis]|uniref:DUF192 domain-containing protein n=1 Tax=Shewanella halifaxensis TaxID=271098 RepID=UPI000D5929D3|nr:DUF192 domain-containing protein [Shewanella halifaxensis]